MAETYATKVQASALRKAAGETPATSSEVMATPSAEEGEMFTSVLRHIGLTSPVTKAVAGALYNQELARQLAEFLRYHTHDPLF